MVDAGTLTESSGRPPACVVLLGHRPDDHENDHDDRPADGLRVELSFAFELLDGLISGGAPTVRAGQLTARAPVVVLGQLDHLYGQALPHS
jgi:hypothetical protein